MKSCRFIKQRIRKGVSRDEAVAFSDDIRDWALGLNIRILKRLNERCPRPKKLEQFAHHLSVPCLVPDDTTGEENIPVGKKGTPSVTR
jgi:hypothetical protein